MKKLIQTVALLSFTTAMLAQDLRGGFLNPPQETRPRVWWHWMDGNITKDGIRKDLQWMHRVGIGGVHCFEAGIGSEPIVDERLTYMSPQWKEAFRYAVSLADSLGMEIAIASCPGWSNTGGPWVKPEQAMKRLVWTETTVKGGRKQTLMLPMPKKSQWYRDSYVIAFRISKDDKTMEELGAKFSQSRVGETPFWIQYSFDTPETIRAFRIADGQYRTIWAAQPAPVNKRLQVSDDGQNYRDVCDIPHGSIYYQTIEIAPTTAKHFRVVFDQAPKDNPELELYTVSRINHSEEKSGFASPVDMNDHPTIDSDCPTVQPSDVINLTDKMDADGNLVWKAPKGNWKILRFGYTLTGKKNHPAPAEATGLEVTKLDKQAFAEFLEHYLNTYRQVLPHHLMGQKGLHYLLIDSYEAGWETWMPRMAEVFEQRRGYSLLPWMPVLTGQIIGSAKQSEEFLFDWRTTIGELIDECMYENASAIARQYGMETYFESHENGRLYLVDGMSAKSHADIPMAAMWTVIPGENALHSSALMAESDIRESASVAHLYGKRFVAAESMTANGETGGAYRFYPGNLKPTADLELASGVNRFVIHESAHQPTDDKRPGLGLMQYGQWFNRHETWAEYAKVWTDYLARSCYMLQQGRNIADVLYYYGEDDVITNLYAHQHPAVPAGYNYDYLNKEALLSLISYNGEQFVTPAGAAYRVLILSKDCRHFSPAVREKLEAMRQQGAPIYDERETSVAEALQGLLPDVQADDMTDLRFVHRTLSNTDIYWLNNRQEKERTVKVTFRVNGQKPELWHPDTGMMEALEYSTYNNTTTVHLTLQPNDAVFVVFSVGGEAFSSREARAKGMTQIGEIASPWTVCFDEQWGGPKEVTFDRLISYTESEDKGIKYYSGTAVYQNKVAVTESELSQGRLILDLGEVGCMAEVIVNDKNMGVLWKTPYRVDITEALHQGENQLEIRVVNQWVNRIIGDRQPDCEKKYTYTPRPFYRTDSPLLPAGLIGPVTLYSTPNDNR